MHNHTDIYNLSKILDIKNTKKFYGKHLLLLLKERYCKETWQNKNIFCRHSLNHLVVYTMQRSARHAVLIPHGYLAQQVSHRS